MRTTQKFSDPLESGSSGQVIKHDGYEWFPGTVAGTGDVVGPASATNLGIVLFDGTTGKLIKDSTLTYDSLTGFMGAASTVFYDAFFFLADNVDPTKLLQFQLSGITSGVNRTLTVPNGSGTLFLASGLSGGQTAIGGTAASNNLSLQSTSNATRGSVISIDNFVIGDGSALDYTISINTSTNDGLITWTRASDYFAFNDDILLNSTERLYLLDTTSYLYATSAGNATLAAATLLTLGVAGNTTVGDGTLRYFYPNTNGKIQLGDHETLASATKGFTGLTLYGDSAPTIGVLRNSTAATAGVNLTVQAGGSTLGSTDKNGGDLVLSPGISTGTGRETVKVKGYLVGATGTTDNTQVDREIVGHTKTLTNNTVTDIVNFTIAAGSVIAGVLRYSIEVRDGTNVQVEEGCISYHVTHTNAGTIANNTTVKFGNQQAMTSGTLTVTWAISAANPAHLSVNANSSLSPSTGYPRVTINLDQLTQQAIALQ